MLNNNWKNYFSYREILLFSLIYKDYKKFGYKLHVLKFKEKIKCFLSIFNLFSFEKYVFKYKKNLTNFRNMKYFVFRIISV